MKLPNVGCLAHVCTMEIYAKVFPPGVVNFIGSFRERAGVVVAEVRFLFEFLNMSTAPSEVAQWLTYSAHNPKVRGSKPRSATICPENRHVTIML